MTLGNKLATSFSEENPRVKTHRLNSKNNLPLKHKVAPVKTARDFSGLYDPPPHLFNKVSWPRPHANEVAKQGLNAGLSTPSPISITNRPSEAKVRRIGNVLFLKQEKPRRTMPETERSPKV